MGRHSDGKPNYRVAKGPLIVVLVAILVGAMIFAWFALRASEREELGAGGKCVKGDLTLVVTADPAVAGAVRDKVNEWAATEPVVRDYCVRPQVTVNGSQQILDVIREQGDGGGAGGAGGFKPVLPAVWVPADDSFVEAARGAGTVGADGDIARFAPEPVGLAVRSDRAPELEGKSWTDLAGTEGLIIATPGGSDAVTSSIVNARLAPDAAPGDLIGVSEPRLAAGGRFTSEALLGQLANGTAEGYAAVAATKSMVDAAAKSGAQGLTFLSPEGSPSLSAPMVAFTSGGPIDETNARAAADLVKFARKNGVDADGPDGGGEGAAGPLAGPAGEIVPGVAARKTDPGAGAPIDSPAPAPEGAPGGDPGAAPPAPAIEPAGSTLVLLDTSAGVDLEPVRATLTPLLGQAAEGEGRRVALWNYSSPMSPGVTSPVRPNVLFGPGAKDRSIEMLGQFGTGGDPWLWRSIGPAVEYAAEAWAPGVANRVVLVTTGRDATEDDARAAIDGIRAAATTDRAVRVDVVIIGEDATGGALHRLASETGGAVHVAGADLHGALVAAMGL